jgi:antitoxin PrlF
MSEPLLEVQSTLTDRYQTTVPDPVRRALKLSRRDRIVYRVQDNGTVTIARADELSTGEDDPVVEAFLDFLARDMTTHPQKITALDADFVARIRALTGDVAIDLDEPLSEDDD